METNNTITVYLGLTFSILFFVPSQPKGQSIPTDDTLHTLLIDAIHGSKEMAIENNRAKMAQNDRKKAYQTYVPTLTFNGSFTHLNDDITFPGELESLLMETQKLIAKEKLGLGFNTPLPAGVPLREVSPIQDQEILRANLQAKMVLFSGLKAPFAAKALEHKEKAYRALQDKEKAEIIRKTIHTYKSMALIHRSEEVLEESERRLNEQRRYVEKAVDQGLASDLEQARIELAAQQLKEKRIELNTHRHLLIALLEQLTGHTAEELNTLSPTLTHWNTIGWGLDAQDRPEVRALNETTKALEFRKRMTYSDYLPKISAFGQKELYKDDLSMLDPEWMVGIGMKWDLFDGFKRGRELQNHSIDIKNSRLKKELITDRLQLNMKNALFELDKANQKIKVAEQRVKTASHAYSISKKQYQVGLISQRDHLDAGNDLQQAELSQSKAIFEQNMAVLNYLIAGGKLEEAVGLTKNK